MATKFIAGSEWIVRPTGQRVKYFGPIGLGDRVVCVLDAELDLKGEAPGFQVLAEDLDPVPPEEDQHPSFSHPFAGMRGFLMAEPLRSPGQLSEFFASLPPGSKVTIEIGKRDPDPHVMPESPQEAFARLNRMGQSKASL